MPARTKGRAKFDFRGRPFVWWDDGDRYLRILSLDKKFIIAYPFVRWLDEPPVLAVIGSEFPSVDRSEPRPVWLAAPAYSGGSMGAFVNDLLTWSFDAGHSLTRSQPPGFYRGPDRVT